VPKASKMYGAKYDLLFKYIKPMLYILVIFAPAVICFLYIMKYGINVIYWDEWLLVPLFAKLYTGHLAFKDLIAQHNEHRILFPRVIMLILGTISHYNTKYEMYFSWLFLCLTSYLLFLIFKKILSCP
jgi:hypothetical protein